MSEPQQGGMKSYIAVWIGLLAIVGVEVFLTYRHFPVRTLLAWLLILAFLEAGIAVLYFMHLRFERPVLLWCLLGYFIFVIFMMDHIWPDAFRVASLRFPAS